MRILQLCSARSIGGGERHLADLANSLQQRGHDVYVALIPGSPVRSALDLPEANILYAQMRNALDVWSASAIARFAKKHEMDLIHGHVGRDYTLAASAAALSKKPYVLTRHMLLPLKRWHKHLLRGVGGVIAPSKAIADALKGQNLIAPDKIETIHHGISVERFSPSKEKRSPQIIVGSVGALAPVKGHDTLIRAAKSVLQARSDVRFVIVGEDDSQERTTRRDLESLIAELGLERHVELAGWRDDVRPLLEHFDIFVSTARAESFGLAIVEAMMCQRPVIATCSEGAQEIIEHEQSGVLVGIDRPDEVAAAILDLLGDRDKRQRLAASGRQRALAHFTLEKMVMKTDQFYERVLARHAP